MRLLLTTQNAGLVLWFSQIRLQIPLARSLTAATPFQSRPVTRNCSVLIRVIRGFKMRFFGVQMNSMSTHDASCLPVLTTRLTGLPPVNMPCVKPSSATPVQRFVRCFGIVQRIGTLEHAISLHVRAASAASLNQSNPDVFVQQKKLHKPALDSTLGVLCDQRNLVFIRESSVHIRGPYHPFRQMEIARIVERIIRFVSVDGGC